MFIIRDNALILIILNMKHSKAEDNQQKSLQIIITGYEVIAKIGMTFPEEIIDNIFEYEHYILMKEHLPMYKHDLKDIEEGHKNVLIDPDWYKRCYSEIDNTFHLQFLWKRAWTSQPLEGAAVYIGRGQIICSKQVPEIEDNILNFCYPCY